MSASRSLERSPCDGVAALFFVSRETKGGEYVDCINLKTHCGDRFRVFFDQAVPTSGSGRDKSRNDPWMMELRGRKRQNGTRPAIYPAGGSLLRLDIDRAAATVNRLVKLGCEIVQDGDREKTVEFEAADLDRVMRIVPMMARPVLSDEVREQRRQLGRELYRDHHISRAEATQ